MTDVYVGRTFAGTNDRVIPTDAARAVGRFNPDGPTGFTSSLGGPVRETRPEAVGDYIATLDAG